MITLILTQGKDSRPVHLEQDLITVGRSKENVITLNDRKVSRHHAKIERIGVTFQISDLDSGNGTRVNGAKIGFQVLSEGDEIKIGDALLRVSAIDVEPGESEDAPASEPEVDLLPEPAPVKDLSREVTVVEARSRKRPAKS